VIRVVVFWDYSNFDIALRGVERGYPSQLKFDYTGFIDRLVGDCCLVKVYFVCSIAPGEEYAPLHRFFESVDYFPYFYVKTFVRVATTSGGTAEKQVDTYLASQIVALAYENAYDEAIVISGDIDLLPAIEIAQQKGKVVTVVAGGKSLSSELKRRADRFVLIDGPRQKELLAFAAR
jgi:uncharacterized LabA/DUF88 family protein